MLDALKEIYNACDPYIPASAEYYSDCAAARGSGALSQEFQNHLRLAKSGPNARQRIKAWRSERWKTNDSG
jgi:hypothetical protein